MSTVATPVGLADFIKGFLEEEETRTDREIAEEVARSLVSLPEEQLLALLAHADMLPNAVRQVRLQAVRNARERVERAALSPGKWETAAENDDIIDWLRAAIIVGGRRKSQGECNRKDCIDMALDRRQAARDTLKQMLVYQAFADELERRRKGKIEDLPHDVIRRILTEPREIETGSGDA